MSNQGVIYFVGTGPGDPGLITVKGLALLREAEAIVGDTLAHAQLLPEACPEAEQHDVGSLQRGNKKPQTEINQLLLDLARQGKTVVRLSEGDPFVFGRAAEEMAAARRAGIRVAVVPGVTSAIAAPAYAGVPVTHWDYGASFAVVSGFTPDDSRVQPNWAALADLETLVILMPLENLPQIVAQLIAAGRPADTPALIVQQGTLPTQKQAQATLGALFETVETQGIESQAIVVVGGVTRLATELAWFEAGAPILCLVSACWSHDLSINRLTSSVPSAFWALSRFLFPPSKLFRLKIIGPLDEAIQESAPPHLLRVHTTIG